MLSERNRLEKEIKSLQAQIDRLPSGKLICARNENRYKWYRSDGKNCTYLPKRERQLAEQLAAKKYLLLLLEELRNEKLALDAYFQQHGILNNKAEELLTKTSEYQKLLSPYFKTKNQELLDWMNSPYEQNMKYPEQLMHRTNAGHYVRSKSELLIDTALFMHRIPYRYECILTIGEMSIFPDFTIRHPKTGEIFYWEHFGKMDDSGYCKSTCLKLQTYFQHGIIPGIQLITTYETKEHPLDMDRIENVIQEHFLKV